MKYWHIFLRYFHTIRHLKFIQIRYQVFYLLRRKLGWKAKLASLSKDKIPTARQLQFQASIPSYTTYLGQYHFSFLNQNHQFQQEIDWNYAAYGKLWTYNLNYFEYLLQPDFQKDTGLKLIHQFIAKESALKDGLEPFPIALRSIFWIKFLLKHQIQDSTIDRFLFLQLELLTRQLEYHLLGNHLLENGFALLFGAFYFRHNPFFKMAENILNEELEEQILADGAHFERSPMYHQLMLYRLLDSINLLRSNPTIFIRKKQKMWEEKAVMMLTWIENMTFTNGQIPHVNDSAYNISPASKKLLAYGKQLNLYPKKSSLTSSAYRKYKTERYEILVNIGDIRASYIPGHAHSDLLHFVLHHRGKALMVDTGTSTYEKNGLRNQERSTAAHNTVQIGNNEQSDVWGGFRVGRRAKVISIAEQKNQLTTSHDGYQGLGVIHERTFEWATHQINILDRVGAAKNAKAYFHFHPSIEVEQQSHTLIGQFGRIVFEHAHQISLETYGYATGFNQTQEATVAIVYFDQFLNTSIQLR